MTTAFKILLLFCVGVSSCRTADNSTQKQRIESVDSIKEVSSNEGETMINDTIRRFDVDDYPVTDDMLDERTSNNSSYHKQSGNIHSFDKVWFTNDAINQTLVFEMYTDKHRSVTFHFYNNDIPESLIDKMELHTKDRELASLPDKKKNFKLFINSANKIEKKYFITIKEFRLGDSKKKALSIYKNPDKIITDGDLEILEWKFIGDLLYDGKTNLNGKPLAKDNYGHQTTMFFRYNKLIAIIFYNDIP